MISQSIGAGPELDDLDRAVRDLAGSHGRVLSAPRLKEGVHRVALATSRSRLNLVAKPLASPVARRVELAHEELQVLFTTAGCARLAADAVLPGLVVAREVTQWGVDRVAEIEQWFDRYQRRRRRQPNSRAGEHA